MTADRVYIDTSVLIKWYVAEPCSEEVEDFLAGCEAPALSSLTLLEWDCAMRRRQRSGALDESYRQLAEREFSKQLAEGLFRVIPVDRVQFDTARHFLEQAAPAPLRALDALHLAAARAGDASLIATADRTMADAAQRLGFSTKTFFTTSS